MVVKATFRSSHLKAQILCMGNLIRKFMMRKAQSGFVNPFYVKIEKIYKYKFESVKATKSIFQLFCSPDNLQLLLLFNMKLKSNLKENYSHTHTHEGIKWILICYSISQLLLAWTLCAHAIITTFFLTHCIQLFFKWEFTATKSP